MLEYFLMTARTLILASASPRRRELLALTGLPFEIQSADAVEIPDPGESPADFVRRMSSAKAQLVAAVRANSAERSASGGQPAAELIIGADTVVTIDNEILGKPLGPQSAQEMLRRLRGRVHQVLTGLTVLDTATGKIHTDLARSAVPMRNYGEAELAAYVATGDPLDKAGAYAIQHPDFHPVDEALFTDCFANVMGLPLCVLLRRLRALGAGPQADLPAACQRFIPYACPVFEAILKEDAA
jgi:septum formation protein